ncbi:hypothetical protein B296_00021369, partial [Ensete ventricosum]
MTNSRTPAPSSLLRALATRGESFKRSWQKLSDRNTGQDKDLQRDSGEVSGAKVLDGARNFVVRFEIHGEEEEGGVGSAAAEKAVKEIVVYRKAMLG